MRLACGSETITDVGQIREVKSDSVKPLVTAYGHELQLTDSGRCESGVGQHAGYQSGTCQARLAPFWQKLLN
jgi:hypothetical protein